MSGTTVQPAVEHLSSILNRFENGDLDIYTQDEISRTITSLESFRNTNSTNNDLFTLCGLVSNVISHLYVARGHATPNVPRNIEYYNNMNEMRRLIQQIKLIK